MIARILFGALAAVLIVGTAASQPPAMTQQTETIKRTPLQKFDVPGTAYETVIGIAEITPNVTIGRHTHPGPESGYMLDGEMVLMIDGQPEKALRRRRQLPDTGGGRARRPYRAQGRQGHRDLRGRKGQTPCNACEISAREMP